MSQTKITITDCGDVNIPNEVKMSIPEIADLFGVFYQTVKKAIRSIEKLNIAQGDGSANCTVEGQNVYPDYYGLDMIIALAFYLQSLNTGVFRKWIMNKLIRDDITTFVLPLQNALLN